jgi:uncharacterized protein
MRAEKSGGWRRFRKYPKCGNAFLSSNFNTGLRAWSGFPHPSFRLIGLLATFHDRAKHPPGAPAGYLHLSAECDTGSHGLVVRFQHSLPSQRTSGDISMTAPSERVEGTVDPKLLEILVCPVTKGPLEFDAARQELISRSAKLAYPIRDGIPIMLPEEARKME